MKEQWAMGQFESNEVKNARAIGQTQLLDMILDLDIEMLQEVEQ